MRDQPRLLGLELQLHPRREEREAFEQPFHVRIGDLHALHPEAPGDLGELCREFGPDLTQVREFVVVEAQEAGVHRR